MVPPPPKGSNTAGKSSPVYFLISASASAKIFSSLEFSHCTIFFIISNKRLRSLSCNSGVGNFSGCCEGSSTIDANKTARAVAKGRRAHHKCSVDGCPCLIDFSFADALLITSSGIDSSINFFFHCVNLNHSQKNCFKKFSLHKKKSLHSRRFN